MDEGPAADSVLTFARDVVRGLTAEPKFLDSKYHYDAAGSELFERICEQPEYYPTRTEEAILRRHASEIAALTGEVHLVELGSGTSVKTQHILRAYLEHAGSAAYVPIDVSRAALEEARVAIGETLPDVRLAPVHGLYEHAFPVLEAVSPALMMFLGSTIGNFKDGAAAAFWTQVSDSMGADDFFLVGVDLVKDTPVLNAAYNDAAGHTEAFTRNLFARMNRELGAHVDVDAIEHVARYNEARSRIETHAHFTRAQEIRIDPLDTTLHVHAGDRVLTEVSRKFRLEDLERDLGRHGLRTRRVFTDERGWFAVFLLQKAAAHG